MGTAGRLVCDAGCVQAAQKDPVGVAMGGTVGHAVCTGIAVVGGRMLATRFDSPVKHVALAGRLSCWLLSPQSRAVSECC